ncbi:MAG: 3-phosphoshikimate 1-carboxyvinyltransferase [Anaerolineaceae bacterium]|nr:3-phosphoshikimate 1-carboxyvinyltransferase [Anaerolineae bacterium]MDL1926670.1 3-phosphoshikimate 1-carboxyvinyltransferase [Anaerolineae bacterium AMX1]WKZ53319.1 MAG: 3-phosphoshikimate 1-carboxyvinyltransferase [Anaerolineales bacterium]GJQ38386.1 MAG: 3-phosphoshikimate 1-carboxyvinyltransferase [Anaerolineaceae bacterium]HMM99009.1 3-phosphoshikimate 1-carboxyvinyltransferase [Anaerolineales bacterium]
MSSSLRITPIGHPLNASVRVPGSKSLTNRALLVAALADGTTRLTNALFSDDSRYFAQALQTLGFDVQLDEANREMTVVGGGGKIPASRAELFIGNAGTAARFLSALLTLGHGEYILDGDARMRERPIGDLVDSLTQLGAVIEPLTAPLSSFIFRPSICPPVKIIANGLRGGKTEIAGDISSQFLSALLMVAPYARTPVEIVLTTELNSKPYVDMTLSIMQDFGIRVQRDGCRSFSVPTANYREAFSRDQSPITNYQSPITDHLSPIPTYPIESDTSAASYFFAAPAICGGTVRVENISRRSVQGDIGFLDVLQKMGCVVMESGDSISVHRAAPLVGVDVDMRDIPDAALTLAAVAPFAESSTRIRGIASARVKESDRVHAACVELARLGVQVEEHADGMTIHPCKKFQPARIQTYNDHRVAMAFSLVGLRVDGVTIENPSCVSKTFPDFFDVLGGLA